MAQSPIRLASTNDFTTSIQVLIGSKKVEFFITPGMYYHSVRQLKEWLKDGWYNHAVSQLVQRSDYVEFDGKRHSPENVGIVATVQRKKNMGRNIPRAINSTDSPDEAHQFTLIAPEANNGLVYQGTRVWHVSAAAAVEYAKELYNANKDASFELVVVQAIEVIRPKPQIELVSRSFVKESASS